MGSVPGMWSRLMEWNIVSIYGTQLGGCSVLAVMSASASSGEDPKVGASACVAYQRRASGEPPFSVISWRAAASAVGLRATRSVTRARARPSSPARAAAAMRVRSMMSRCAWLPPTALARGRMSMSRSMARSGPPGGERGERLEQGQAGPPGGARVRRRGQVPVRRDHPLGPPEVSGQAERHHRVPVVEDVDGAADQVVDVGRELLGAFGHVGAEQRQPPQQRGRVHDVEPLGGPARRGWGRRTGRAPRRSRPVPGGTGRGATSCGWRRSSGTSPEPRR